MTRSPLVPSPVKPCILGSILDIATGTRGEPAKAGAVALNAITGELSWVEAERKTSTLFLLLLWHLLKEVYPTAKRIYVILDNYRIHSSRQVELALADTGGRIQLCFLPPYCPDDNRIERVWRDLHGNVTRNHRCRTMGELMGEVRRYLRQKNQHLQRLYAAKMAA